jgi:putative spermidine/putrescine transport system ATP-binding protein
LCYDAHGDILVLRAADGSQEATVTKVLQAVGLMASSQAGVVQGTKGSPHVQFKDVQKSYDGKTLVVKSLNLDIQKGEFLTMLGPSGSGKTTTLMMLAGFETATHGEIFLKGQPINSTPPNKRGIGMVFQNYALFPHMTVVENLAFPLQVRGMDKPAIQAKVTRALEMVSLAQFGARKPAQLSGGQQQRVAVARALVFEPDIVLMDEPLGALDKQLREQMQYEIKTLTRGLGVTVVYVTHDQSEALTMSDRIAVFNDGIIQQLSTPSELYEAPINSFVAQFIGENNKLSGSIRGAANGICRVTLADGTEVEAVDVNTGADGAATMLSIRPERVEVDPSATGMGAEFPNRITGTVNDIIYLGDHLRARLTAAGSTDFVVKAPNREGQRRLEKGQSVTLGWRTKDCRALDPLS